MQISCLIFPLSTFFAPLSFYPDFILDFFPDFLPNFFLDFFARLLSPLITGAQPKAGTGLKMQTVRFFNVTLLGIYR